MKQKVLYFALSLLLLFDLFYSYRQYSRTFIDGDFPAIVMGVNPYDRVLNDPLGFAALSGDVYAAPNRYSSHAVMSQYFKNMPLLLQSFMSPIDSVYASITIVKMLAHILLLFLLSYYASAWDGFKKGSILLCSVLISPFFHAGDLYMNYLTVIDPIITYVMFYAVPMILLLIFLLPFYRYYFTGHLYSSTAFIATWSFLALVLAFYGALPSPIILILIIFILAYTLWQAWSDNSEKPLYEKARARLMQIHPTMRSLGIWSIAIGLYSMFIGTKNAENLWSPMPLMERFALLPKGLADAFLNNLSGLSYLAMACAANLLFLIFYRKTLGRYFSLILLLLLFAGIYFLLLPLGGYRFYRPLIVRRDTLFPVLCILFYIWGSAAMLLFQRLERFRFTLFFFFVIFLSFFYTNKENLSSYADNTCERKMLEKIALSQSDCILLDKGCNVASWNYNMTCPESETVAAMLYYYHITPRKIHFYYK